MEQVQILKIRLFLLTLPTPVYTFVKNKESGTLHITRDTWLYQPRQYRFWMIEFLSVEFIQLDKGKAPPVGVPYVLHGYRTGTVEGHSTPEHTLLF